MHDRDSQVEHLPEDVVRQVRVASREQEDLELRAALLEAIQRVGEAVELAQRVVGEDEELTATARAPALDSVEVAERPARSPLAQL